MISHENTSFTLSYVRNTDDSLTYADLFFGVRRVVRCNVNQFGDDV